MDKPYSEDYYKLAMAIVEPKGPEEVLEDYHNFMENDPQNWKGFVINTIGDDYIPIIDFILENGY
jgi:hypothetical protein